MTFGCPSGRRRSYSTYRGHTAHATPPKHNSYLFITTGVLCLLTLYNVLDFLDDDFPKMQVTLCILAEEDHRVPVPSDSLSTDGEDLLLTSVPFVFFGNQGARYNWRGNQLHPVVPGGSQRMMYQHQGNPEEVNMRLFSIKHLERQDKKKAWEIIEELRKLRGANVNWERVPRLQRDCFNASKELIKQCMRSVTMVSNRKGRTWV